MPLADNRLDDADRATLAPTLDSLFAGYALRQPISDTDVRTARPSVPANLLRLYDRWSLGDPARTRSMVPG